MDRQDDTIREAADTGRDTLHEGSLTVEEKAGFIEVDDARGASNRLPDDAGGSGAFGAMQAGSGVFDRADDRLAEADAARTDTMGGLHAAGRMADAGTGGNADDTLNMSNDNTGGGPGLFASIREGMRVVDAGGKDVGKVEFVHAGDPGAATTMGEGVEMAGDPDAVAIAPAGGGTSGSAGLAGSGSAGGFLGGLIGGGGDEPDVEEPQRSQLMRTGFIRVDGKGWFGADRFVGPDQIASVTGVEVRLRGTGG